MGQPVMEPALTRRQREVLELLGRGHTNREIGERLGISLDGAKWHVSEVLGRLGFDTREEAADYWRRQNGLRPRLFRVWAAAISLRAAVLVLGVLAALAAVVVSVLLFSGDDDDALPADLAESATASPALTLAPAATSSAGATTSSTPPGPQLSVISRAQHCPTPEELDFQGEGFAPGSEVEIHMFTGLDSAVPVARGTAGAAGNLTVELIPAVPLPPHFCQPRHEYVFQASPAGGGVQPGGPRAVLAIPHIGVFEVEPASGVCGPVTLRLVGRDLGVAPGTVLRLAVGEADPFAHVFAEIGTVTVDDAESFETEINVNAFCDEPTAVYASSDRYPLRWKAVYDGAP
jgi:DNA-binding CsgD family transcriptional regulator